MAKTSKPPKSTVPDHVPGPMEQAAVRTYFERGSQQAIEKNGWKTAALMSSACTLIAISGLVVMAARSEVEVFQVAKTDGGQLQVVAAAGKFTPDEDTQMAWTSRWLSELTEISPALWQRNVASVQSKIVGTAADQVKTYLQRAENNPAFLLTSQPSYIREYERRSVNKVGEMTYLVRYELINRPAPGGQVERATYAATVTLTTVGHRNRNDVFSNPEGLAVSSFSISQESSVRKP